MSERRRYTKKTNLFDHPELVQRLRQSRTNYDYPVAKISDFLGDWVVLETFVTNVNTKYGKKSRPATILILSTLQDPSNPDSDRTWERYRAFCWSERINKFLLGLRESDLELIYLPLVLRFIEVPFIDYRTGAEKSRYEIDCGLSEPPTKDTEN